MGPESSGASFPTAANAEPTYAVTSGLPNHTPLYYPPESFLDSLHPKQAYLIGNLEDLGEGSIDRSGMQLVSNFI